MSKRPQAGRYELVALFGTLALASELKIENATWKSLADEEASTLRKAISDGIAPDNLSLRLFTYAPVDSHEQSRLIIASYGDAAGDFSAYYMVQGSWLVASYEN